MQDVRHIIASYLLDSGVSDPLSLSQVAAMFPVACRNHPLVLELHREYEKFRLDVKQKVLKGIENHVRTLTAEPVRSQKRPPDVVDKPNSNRRLSLDGAVERLKLAEIAMSNEIKEIEDEIGLWTEEFQTLEKDLSAIRYPSRKPGSNSSETKINRALQELVQLVKPR